MDSKNSTSSHSSVASKRTKLKLGREVIRELTAVKTAGRFGEVDAGCPAGPTSYQPKAY